MSVIGGSEVAASEGALQESEARIRALVRATTDFVYCMSADWVELRELDGRGIIASTEEPRSDWMDVYIDPEDRSLVAAAVEEAIANGKVFELEHRVKRIDGSFSRVLSRATPIRNERGEIREWLGIASDLTARRNAQDELARVTGEAERQRRFYEQLISSTPDLVYAFDLDRRFIFANRALLEMWDRTLEESVGRSLVEIGYEPWHAEMHEREIDRIIQTKQPIRGEVGFPHATQGWRIYDYIFTPVFDEAGEVEKIAGTTRDITDIKRAEEHLKLLLNELNHRVKNTLATVQSIAAMTFRGTDTDPRARSAFEARLMALSDVHTVLAGTNWEGANLREIAGRMLAPFRSESGDGGRIQLDGPDLQVRPQMALSVAMALHELASNAAKYGALSNDTGVVSLSWSMPGGAVEIVWRESQGPAVLPPDRRGFGTRLIEGLARELDGQVDLRFLTDGVTCSMSFPHSEGVQG